MFISHTNEFSLYPPGQASYVQHVKNAITARGFVVVDMSEFPSVSDVPAELCSERVQSCDVLIGILGTSYGSPVRDRPEVSYCELEFDVARAHGIDRLMFVLDVDAPNVGIPASALIDPFNDRQDAFRSRVRAEVTSAPAFESPPRLGQLVERSLLEWEQRLRRAGNGSAPTALPRPKVHHDPPAIIPVTLRDRVPDLDLLRDLVVSQRHRVMALVGDAGCGKTALVSELMTRLAQDRSLQCFAHLDYMSATGYLPVNGVAIVDRMINAVEPTRQEILRQVVLNRSASWTDSVGEVLSSILGDMLLVIDHVEDHLDERGRFTDPAVQKLLVALSESDAHPVTVLLVSSQAVSDEILGPRIDATFPLSTRIADEGEAGLLLQDLLRSLPVTFEDENRALDWADHHPRSLELAVAAQQLGADLSTGWPAGVDGGGEPTQRTAWLLAELIDSLPGPERAVLRVVAILGLPTEAAVLSRLLADVVPAATVAAALRELSRMRIVRHDQTGCFSLPVAEAAAVRSVWRSEPEGAQTERGFLIRAADEYTAARMRTQVHTIEDLKPHFREIALLMDAQQYVRCVRLMDEMDDRYLRGWGHQHVLMPWRRRLLHWHVGEHYWRANISAMVSGAVEIDELAEANLLLEALEEQPLNASPLPVSTEDTEQLRKDKLAVLSQRGYVAFHGGILRVAQARYQEELELAAFPHEQARAHLGIAVAALQQGSVVDARAHLVEAESLTEQAVAPVSVTLKGSSVGASAEAQSAVSALRASSLQLRAVLAQVIGEASALTLSEQSWQAAVNVKDDRLIVQALDLRAAILLQLSQEESDPLLADRWVQEALAGAMAAAERAARTGVTDVTRSAHATLAICHLSPSRLDLEAARSAALSAARFSRSSHALLGHVTLGIVQLREEAQRGALDRVRGTFSTVLQLAEQFPVEAGRPYWVWDAMGLAHTGLHLCRVPGSVDLALDAYATAREVIPAKGAVQRADLLFSTLVADRPTTATPEIRHVLRHGRRPAGTAGAVTATGQEPPS